MDGARRFDRRELLRTAGVVAAGAAAAWACSDDRPIEVGEEAPRPVPRRGERAAGQFRTVGPDIIGPDGRRFLSLGANGVCRPFPEPEWWTERTAVDGKVAEALGWGWNTIRLHVYVDPEGTGIPRSHTFDGILRTIDEYTRSGIVVMAVAYDHQGENPSYRTLRRSGVVDLQDEIVAAHGRNPYLWLNPLDEPTAREGYDRWYATGRSLHDRAREQGFEGVFVWDLPHYGQGLELIATTDLGADFLERTTNTAFGWHNFGAADHATQDEWARRVRELGLPVHIGGFGQGWDPTRPSVSPSWPTMDRDERRGTEWVLTRFFEFGFGAVMWHGTGYVGGAESPYSLRRGDNLPWYDFPGAPPLSELGERMYALGQELRSA